MVLPASARRRPSPRERLEEGDRERMEQPAEHSAVRLPENARLLERDPKALHVRLDQGNLGLHPPIELSCPTRDSPSPDSRQRALNDDRDDSHAKQDFAKPGGRRQAGGPALIP